MTTETSNARGEWVLVPRVPTDEMLDAGIGKYKHGGLWSVYTSMLAAAPPPAAAQQQGQVAPPSAPVGVEAALATVQRYAFPMVNGHDETVRKCERCDSGRWVQFSDVVTALAQQPAAVDEALSEKAESWCAHCLSPPHMWGMICCHEYVASGGKTLRLTASEAKLEHERRNALATQHQEPTT